MDPAQITAELPRLTHAERRELMRQLLALEEDAPVLAEYDRPFLALAGSVDGDPDLSRKRGFEP